MVTIPRSAGRGAGTALLKSLPDCFFAVDLCGERAHLHYAGAAVGEISDALVALSNLDSDKEDE